MVSAFSIRRMPTEVIPLAAMLSIPFIFAAWVQLPRFQLRRELFQTNRAYKQPLVVRIPTTYTTQDSSSGSSKLAADAGLIYYGTLAAKISIGTPSQTVRVTLDTGSSKLWARGSSCTASVSCPGAAGSLSFDPTLSSTFMTTSANVTNIATYGDGLVVLGVVGSDTVALAGISVPGSTVYYATSITIGTATLRTDGILGIAAGTLGVFPTLESQSISGHLLSTKILDSNIWGFWQNASAATTGLTYTDGLVTLGGIDEKLYSGNITWIDLMWKPSSIPASQSFNAQYWYTALTALNVGTTNVLTLSKGGSAYVFGQISSSGFVINTPLELPLLIDTGTTLCLLPQAMVDAIGSLLQAQQSTVLGVPLYGPNCSAIPFASLPTITFTIGGKILAVPPTGYTFANPKTGDYCTGAFVFQGSAAQYNGGILGNLILRSFYTLFDVSNRRIGFATPSMSGSGAGVTFQDPAANGTLAGTANTAPANGTITVGSASGASRVDFASTFSLLATVLVATLCLSS
ncbi:hypothetical protein SmJEL517_g03907 [Synchytrium microbalum]|uniref:Peptidase A1 domain-containing protein n=1 Tax=Synchytrium microbalum TaxID=1806994 RepID=A0A507C4L9_9FUNG|nr:uncharacterized protein SmJEL517_g03907 [Synchytrium microbalum]TPX33074.1 hypothetical protein SmJEL517_g03907 [Synchytrium microbalum]